MYLACRGLECLAYILWECKLWYLACGKSPPPIDEVLLCPKLSLVEMASRLVVFELRYLDFVMPLLKFIAGHWIPRD